MPVTRSVDLPFVRVEYDRTAPSSGALTVTRAGSVAVAFTSQRQAVWHVAGREFSGQFPASVSLPGGSHLVWHDWSDVSEAVEFWLDDNWLAGISGVRHAAHRLEPRLHFQDVVFRAVAVEFRRALASSEIDPLRFEELAVVAAQRLLRNTVRIDQRARGAPLDDRRLTIVHEFIEANLAGPITLSTLASVAGISMFHFAKRFRAATGASPYTYVIGCRMNRAMQLLRHGWTVKKVAAAVGYSSVAHFRQQFRAHWRQSPGHLEGAG